MSPFVLVLFGATGDLARNKLIPALYSVYKKQLLGDEFFIIGFARRPFKDNEYAQMLGDELDVNNQEEWSGFAKNIYYQQGLFNEEAGYLQLIERLNKFDKKIGACITRLFIWRLLLTIMKTF
jgi:glucose-6-phosphate 1-dehydrogenase